MEKVPFTINGLENLKNEFNNLKKIQRPEIIKAISIARDHGDLSEIAEYHAAKENQSFIEGRITELESVLSRAEVIDLKKLDGKKVTFGTKVTVYDEDADKKVEFSIVTTSGPSSSPTVETKMSGNCERPILVVKT